VCSVVRSPEAVSPRRFSTDSATDWAAAERWNEAAGEEELRLEILSKRSEVRVGWCQDYVIVSSVAKI
jgi:hypothetical protein